MAAPRRGLDFRSAEDRFAVLCCIFGFLDHPRDLAVCARVCRFWRPAAESAVAWAPLGAQRGFPPTAGHAKILLRNAHRKGRDTPRVATQTPGLIQMSTAVTRREATVALGDFRNAVLGRCADPRLNWNIVVPSRSVDAALGALKRKGRGLSAAASPSEGLDNQLSYLEQRLTGHKPQWALLHHNVERLLKDSAKVVRDTKALCRDQRDTETRVEPAGRRARALAVRRRRINIIKDFERLCCTNILRCPDRTYAVYNSGLAAGDEVLLRAALRNSSSVSLAPPPPSVTCLESFAQMELFCIGASCLDATVHVRWSLLKRALPLCESYYDLRDALGNPATFPVEDYALGTVNLGPVTTDDENGAQPQLRDLRKVADEVVRRQWCGNQPPPIIEILLDKIFSCFEAAARDEDHWDMEAALLR